jgi:peptidoglycan L-alanyl-D-glutamate endopeptidase CwlK
MATFGTESESKLKTLHPKLVLVMRSAIEVMDFKIIYTDRSVELQNELVNSGLSQKLNSKHIIQADGFSHAVDIAPFYAWKRPQIDWKDTKAFYYLAGIVMGHAYELGVQLRYGGDWNHNNDLNDQSFFDLSHFELAEYV